MVVLAKCAKIHPNLVKPLSTIAYPLKSILLHRMLSFHEKVEGKNFLSKIEKNVCHCQRIRAGIAQENHECRANPFTFTDKLRSFKSH